MLKKGDTLNKLIIRIYGKKDPEILKAILKINPEIDNPNLIYENQIIRFPDKINLSYNDLLDHKKNFQRF